MKLIAFLFNAIILGPPRELWKSIKGVARFIKLAPGRLFSVPARLYRRIIRVRNKLLAVVEYLQAESNKWRTVFNVVKSPYTTLRWLGVSPNLAGALLVSTAGLGGGVIVNETILADASFSGGSPGQYSAPLDKPLFYNETYNTLRVDLGSTRVSELIIDSTALGTSFIGSAIPSPATTAIDVGGSLSATSRLVVGELTFSRNRCKQLQLKDLNVHRMVVSENLSDGQSISVSPGNQMPLRVLSGDFGAERMATDGGRYDRLWINVPTGTGYIDQLKITNNRSAGGACILQRMNIGTLTIANNEIGADSNLATKDFEIATTVNAKHLTLLENHETLISEMAPE